MKKKKILKKLEKDLIYLECNGSDWRISHVDKMSESQINRHHKNLIEDLKHFKLI